MKLEADNLETLSMEWRYHGTHLFDFLWTSFPSYRRLPGSASAAYTWQLCFYGVLLGVVGVKEWAHLELIESSQESVASKEYKFCQLQYPPLKQSSLLIFVLTLPKFPFSSGILTVLLFSTLV